MGPAFLKKIGLLICTMLLSLSVFSIAHADIKTVDMNSENIEELQELPGIGSKKAQSIVDYRKDNSCFTALNDLVQVTGIKEKTVRKIQQKIDNGTLTVEYNNCPSQS